MKNEKLNELDMLLMLIQDSAHGELMDRITEARELLKQALMIPVVSNLLCGAFEIDTKTSSATKCKCGREKWEHPKAK